MMEIAIESSLFSRSTFISTPKSSPSIFRNRQILLPIKLLPPIRRYPCRFATNCAGPYIFSNALGPRFGGGAEVFDTRNGSRFVVEDSSSKNGGGGKECASDSNIEGFRILAKKGLVLAAMVCGIAVLGCRRVLAVEGVANAAYSGIVSKCVLQLKNALPTMLQILRLFKEQGLILAVLLSLSAFFSMAETSITTLWPWKVRELAEKEPENGVFRMLQSDVTRFLTTILIGTKFLLLMLFMYSKLSILELPH